MTVQKTSVSIDAQLLAFAEHYQVTHHLRSRSEVFAEALTLLRERELETQYAAALSEWHASDDEDLWDAVAGDLLTSGGPNAPR
ncbi:hypothetical protein GCM10008956_39570 [Deinococcus arenae]|uniref:Antitoxin n=1 Tax=Deinococcus arenae TaxID=1452751 RepID=A0A8H9GSL9_9DEIO|nr:antitoxin [Deinococcus arenae]AWT37433.1 antitoxin [Deinococcus actinosclerus]GGM59961.1 hypothetical protein GCM10008956_39570 [Deinococcus arenae]